MTRNGRPVWRNFTRPLPETAAENGRIHTMKDGGERQWIEMEAKKKYKVGITVGVFDLFHVGHLNLLERCKAMCDKLIVAVCGDDYVADVKKKTPVYPADQRCRILAALKCVDEVVLVSIDETEDKMLLLKNHPFDVLFSGDDWKGSERYRRTEEQFAKLGVAIEYLPYTKGISTTQLKEQVATGA